MKRTLKWAVTAILIVTSIMAGPALRYNVQTRMLSFRPPSARAMVIPDTIGGKGEVKVPILIYHDVHPFASSDASPKPYLIAPETFERELRYLQANGYTAITMRDLLQSFSGNFSLPVKPVIITFDDGCQGQFTYALPLLKKYHDVATFYVISGFVGKPGYLTWPEIRSLDQNGMIIGGHTRNHPKLTRIQNAGELRSEIAGGKDDIEKQLGKPIDDFAYPHGCFDERVIQAVREAGYETARTTRYGSHHSPKSRFSLKGYIIHSDFAHFLEIIQTTPSKTKYLEELLTDAIP